MGVVPRILVGLIMLFCLGMAVMWMAMPATGAPQFGLTLNGVQGISSARADVGGMFLATAVLCLLGIAGSRFAAAYLNAAAIIMGSVALGRLVGFIVDGVVQMTVMPFMVELLFVAVLVFAGRSLTGIDPG